MIIILFAFSNRNCQLNASYFFLLSFFPSFFLSFFFIFFFLFFFFFLSFFLFSTGSTSKYIVRSIVLGAIFICSALLW